MNIDFQCATIKRAANLRHYLIGVFSGQNYLEETILFGIGIINTTMEKRFHLLLSEFFKILPKPPSAVVCSDSSVIQKILGHFADKLGFKVYINWYYMLKRFENRFYPEKNAY